MQRHKSLSYEVKFESQFTGRDTGRTESIVHLYRDERDSIMGGMIWLSDGIKYDRYTFYDLDQRYTVMKKDRQVLKEKISTEKKMRLNTYTNDLYAFPFLHTQYWIKKFGKDEIQKLADTSINGVNCFAIQRTYKYPNKHRYFTEIYFINKIDYFPIARVRHQHFGKNVEWSKLDISNYQFDKVSTEQFSAKQIPSNYTIEMSTR